MELLIGCGSEHSKRLCLPGREQWNELVTLDFNSDHKPDVVHDICDLPLPFGADTFDEVHAYEVMEHTGQQGDFRWFFRQWEDFWRILKPGGHFFGTSPSRESMWAWGDPGHTRIMTAGCFIFLNQEQYKQQVGKTEMSDYRFCYRADFESVGIQETKDKIAYVLRAVKPSRWEPPS